MRLTFVIPVRNDPVRLDRCLTSIAKNRADGVTVDIIVADNGSTDDTPNVARKHGAAVLSLPGLTVAELRNRAAAEAKGDVVAFIDADHELVPTWIARAKQALVAEKTGAAGAQYLAPSNGTWVQRAYGALRGRTVGVGETRWLASGNLAVKRAAFSAINGFDASLEACEDVDFCQRLRAAGWLLIADEGLESVHLGDPPTLKAVFRGERWRGRDNVRVTLRGPLSARELPSVVIPIVDLMILFGVPLALIASAWLGRPAVYAALAGLVVFTGLSILRTLKTAAAGLGSSSFIDVLRVVLVYDAARAVALITRAKHHRERPRPARG